MSGGEFSEAEQADRARRRSQGTHIIRDEVVVELNETPAYENSPGWNLEEAVLGMISDFNVHGGYGKGPVPPGYVVRVRVVTGECGDYRKRGYSPLDRFKFDGKTAASLFPGSPETTTVGAFANAVDGCVLMQIAGYGRLEKRGTQLQIGGAPDEEWGRLFQAPQQ